MKITPGVYDEFTDLGDTPNSYTGEGGNYVRVNVGENGLEFAAVAGGTDEKVKIDAGATAGYIGAANNDGVLRAGTGLTYTDGGNFVTLDLAAHKDSHDPQDGSDKLDTAAASEIVGVQAAGVGSSHSFAKADHAHQIQHGITDNHLVTVDSSSIAANQITMWTASGLDGYAQVGSTFPTNLTDGMRFVHELTGRKILYVYDADNTTWVPIISIGTMTLYVDKTDGTDDMTHGTAADASAFATIQYAVDIIPGLVGGNVTIYINNESYAENVVVEGKSFTGNYSITLQGTLNSQEDITADGNGVKGAAANMPAFYEDGMVANEFQNMILKFTSGANDGTYSVIDSNSNDAGTHLIYVIDTTLAAQPVNNDTATVYDWGTDTTSITIDHGQMAVNIYDIECTGTILVKNNSQAIGYRIKAAGSGASDLSIAKFENCLFDTNAIYSFYAHQSSAGTLIGCKMTGGYAYQTLAQMSAIIGFRACVIEGATTTGCFVIGNSTVSFWCADVYNFVRDNTTYGIRAETGAIVIYTTMNSYSGNGTDESAVAAEYAYID